MSGCSYCGGPGPFTREHLYPQWLYEQTTHYDQQFLLAKPDKFINGQLTIRDTCRKCNTGILSKLDSYARKLYDTYFDKFIMPDELLNFTYDFDLLTRWLLKVSYNSARVHKSDADELSKYTDYILSGSNKPQYLSVFLRLIIPYRFSREEQKHLPATIADKKEYPPAFIRIAPAQSSPEASRFSVCRMIGINSYYFYVLLPRWETTRQIWRATLRDFESWFPGSERIPHNQKDLIIRASKIHSFQVAGPHLERHLPLYLSAMPKTDKE